MLAEQNRDLTEAIRLYDNVIQLARDQKSLAAEARYRQGLLYERVGRHADAERAFRQVIHDYPDQNRIVSLTRAKLPKTNGAIEMASRRIWTGQTSITGALLRRMGVFFPSRIGAREIWRSGIYRPARIVASRIRACHGANPRQPRCGRFSPPKEIGSLIPGLITRAPMKIAIGATGGIPVVRLNPDGRRIVDTNLKTSDGIWVLEHFLDKR